MPRTTDENIKFFDSGDFANVIDFIHETKSVYGNYSLHLTKEDLKQLEQGKCLVWGMGQYTVLIYLEDK